MRSVIYIRKSVLRETKKPLRSKLAHKKNSHVFFPEIITLLQVTAFLSSQKFRRSVINFYYQMRNPNTFTISTEEKTETLVDSNYHYDLGNSFFLIHHGNISIQK